MNRDDALIAALQKKPDDPEPPPECKIAGCGREASVWPVLELRARDKDAPFLAVMRIDLCAMCSGNNRDPQAYLVSENDEFWIRLLRHFDKEGKRRPKRYKTKLRFTEIGNIPEGALS